MKTVNDILKDRWSFSRVTTYEKCPHAFKLHYLDEIKDATSEAQHLGLLAESLLHLRILEKEAKETDVLNLDTRMLAEKLSTSAFLELQKHTSGIPEYQKQFDFDISYADGLKIPVTIITDFYYPELSLVVDLKTCKDYSSWTAKKANEHGQLSLYADVLTVMTGNSIKAAYLAVNKTDYRARWLEVIPTGQSFSKRMYSAFIGVKKGMFTPCPQRLCKVYGYREHCINQNIIPKE